MDKTRRFDVYRCMKCGNIVEVIHEGAPALVCCGQPMKKLKELSKDAAKEKHLPVVEQSGGKLKVKVGSVPHPMEEAHYIEWIQVLAHGREYRHYLKPGEVPEAVFDIDDIDIARISVREYCNVHGLWKYAK